MNGDHRLGRPPAKPWRSVLGRKVYPPSQGIGPSANLLFETDNHPLPDGTYDPSPGKRPARSTTLDPKGDRWAGATPLQPRTKSA